MGLLFLFQGKYTSPVKGGILNYQQIYTDFADGVYLREVV